jgi:methionyl-tRNA formyltransferase
VRGVFLGTPAIAVPTLEALVSAGHDVAVVVTRPDRPAHRSATPRPPAVKEAAMRLGLEVIQPESVRDRKFRESLERVAPDVVVVVAYGKILPQAVLEIPRLAPINVHFSLLPRYRGAAPVQWALARGETTTGVTTMVMSEGLDEGDVLLQQEVDIEPAEHAPRLLGRLAEIGGPLLCRTLDGLRDGTVEPRPQDAAAATLAPMLRIEDGIADFSLTAAEIEGRVRGFDPWPGLWAQRRGKRVRIVDAAAVEGETTPEPPGRVIELKDDVLTAACGKGTILAIRAVQPEGRRAQSARDAVNGRQILPGDDLGHEQG